MGDDVGLNFVATFWWQIRWRPFLGSREEQKAPRKRSWFALLQAISLGLSGDRMRDRCCNNEVGPEKRGDSLGRIGTEPLHWPVLNGVRAR